MKNGKGYILRKYLRTYENPIKTDINKELDKKNN